MVLVGISFKAKLFDPHGSYSSLYENFQKKTICDSPNYIEEIN